MGVKIKAGRAARKNRVRRATKKNIKRLRVLMAARDIAMAPRRLIEAVTEMKKGMGQRPKAEGLAMLLATELAVSVWTAKARESREAMRKVVSSDDDWTDACSEVSQSAETDVSRDLWDIDWTKISDGIKSNYEYGSKNKARMITPSYEMQLACIDWSGIMAHSEDSTGASSSSPSAIETGASSGSPSAMRTLKNDALRARGKFEVMIDEGSLQRDTG
jgi:hypothetical protein